MTHSLQPGVLIAFEGIDGAGKTTQATLLADFLRAEGFDVVFTKEPTTGPWGQKIRESAQTGRMSPEDELAAFIQDRKEHVRDTLLPGLARGAIIIVDRYYFSTVAYQGARGMDVSELLALNEAFAPEPDMLVLLDIDPKAGLDRVNSRGQADLFENVPALTKSRAIFESLDKPYAIRLDAVQSVEALQVKIQQELLWGPLLRRLCPEAKDGGGCSHLGRISQCEWSQLEGFHGGGSGGPIDAIVNDPSLSDDAKIAAIRHVANP